MSCWLCACAGDLLIWTCFFMPRENLFLSSDLSLTVENSGIGFVAQPTDHHKASAAAISPKEDLAIKPLCLCHGIICWLRVSLSLLAVPSSRETSSPRSCSQKPPDFGDTVYHLDPTSTHHTTVDRGRLWSPSWVSRSAAMTYSTDPSTLFLPPIIPALPSQKRQRANAGITTTRNTFPFNRKSRI